jgi:predicted short-subunit dehydrogenase-like oxidoreductase (DUF2520 family)
VSGAPQFDAPGVAARPGRFAVGVIGTGRVGAVLGAALARAGHRVVAASAVSDRSRRRAAELLPDTALLPPPEVAAAAELLVLAVPDDVLPELVVGLTEAGLFRPGQTVLHPSGRHGIGVLEAARIRGVLPLALHPVMSFTGTDVDLARLTGCSFGVTAPEAFRPMAEALVVEMGGEPEWIAEADRPLYHAALAFGANFLTTLVAQAAELLTRAGVSEPGRMLGPLLGATLDNSLRSGDAALTGPVARGDAGTVAAHLSQLSKLGNLSGAAADPVLNAYLAMARLTADRALEAGLLAPERAGELLEVLNEDGGR